MDRVDTASGSDFDFDFDLESGGTTSGEDAPLLIRENILGRIKSGFRNSEAKCKSPNDKECSCSNEKLSISEAENKEQLGKYREEMISFVHEMEKEPKKKHCKPPRPPTGDRLSRPFGLTDLTPHQLPNFVNIKLHFPVMRKDCYGTHVSI